MDRRALVVMGMALVVGALGVAAAWALEWLIAVITNLAYHQRLSREWVPPSDHHLGVWATVVPALGGLVVGLLARYGSEKVRGHGLPEALEAILLGQSRVTPRAAVLKPLSSAISIGSGGPFGAEGPIIAVGGSFGSLFAQCFHLSDFERRTMLAAGAAAGISAVFAAPLTAVLLALELLLFEWRPRSLIPVALAATVASALRTPLMGEGPRFLVTAHAPPRPAAIVTALALGLVVGLAASGITHLVRQCERLFHKLPIHWMWWPALGGVLVGLGGLAEPRVLGPGYELVHGLLQGDIVGLAALGLLGGKALVWSIGLGSGTSGGLLVPLLLLGGALGAVAAALIPMGDPGLWVAVGMAAKVGSSMRLPLTATVLLVEMTHDVNLLPAVLAGSMAAHAVGVFALRRSLITDKVARSGRHVTYEYGIDPLAAKRVSEVMDHDPPTVPATMTVGDLVDLVARHDPRLGRHHGAPIVTADGRLAGIVTRSDLARALEQEAGIHRSVLDAGSRELIVAHPHELVHAAATRMLVHQVGRLVVVDPADPLRLLGYLGRRNIFEARAGQLMEEDRRERTLDLRAWTRRRVPTPPPVPPGVVAPAPGRRWRTKYRDA